MRRKICRRSLGRIWSHPFGHHGLVWWVVFGWVGGDPPLNTGVMFNYSQLHLMIDMAGENLASKLGMPAQHFDNVREEFNSSFQAPTAEEETQVLSRSDATRILALSAKLCRVCLQLT